MRILVVLGVVVGAIGIAAAGPIDAIARVARTRTREPLLVSFQPEPCTLSAGDATIPLRKVTWSMTKETDGTNDAIVTARCGNGTGCVTTGKASSPRFSFRLATDARQARTMLGELKGLTTHCG